MLCIAVLAILAAAYELAATTSLRASAPEIAPATADGEGESAPADAAPPAATPPASAASATCLECHTDETLSMEKNGRTVSLLVTAETVAKSAHGAFDCADCHEGLDADAIPHKDPMPRVDCFSCHEDIAAKHAFHPRLAQTPLPAGEDTDCASCHGTHAISKVADTSFVFARTHQAEPEACGKCHETARNHFLASAHGRTLVTRPADAPDCIDCHAKPGLTALNAPPTVARKLAQAFLCESCHLEKPGVASHTLRGTRFVASFEHSVHGAALQRGDASAATCIDCHGAHQMNRAVTAGARISHQRQAATCGECHEKEATLFGDSVHAEALRKGSRDAPVCTDCHGEHDIRAHTDPSSPVHARNVAQQVCATCHDSLRLTKKYGLASHAFQTFADSYHGLAVRGGAVEVVNCASCHSAHGIKSHLDSTSTVHKSNLVQTCGECHPGANTRFTIGSVHVSPTTLATADASRDGLVLRWIATAYVFLIVGVVGGMFAHNALDFIKKIRRKLAIQKGIIEEEHVAHRLYVRMTVHERLQHGTLVISFVLLVITGFMLSYPEAWWVVAIRRLSAGAFEWRSLVHRVAGVVMLASGAWHISYLVFTKPGRALFRDLLPRRRDLIDPWRVLRYNLGLAPTKPAFDRFCYIEKAEYWALVWGTLLMGVTGGVLWFDNTSMGLFTKLGFDIARTIHFYEAILATLAIIVWHFYFVIFNPDVYPMNLSWLTGRMSEREMLEEHPAQLARLKAETKATESPPAPAAADEH